jgi:hypothetical protein
MSMSLRDQLLKAGLINKQQANEAERQQRRKERQPQQHNPAAAADRAPAPKAATAVTVAQAAQAAKVAHDQALNRQQQERAQKKARMAQIKQLIAQNRLPAVDGYESYNFADGTKIRRIAINPSYRARLMRGEIAIVGHEERYDWVPTAIASRIRELDERAFIGHGAGKDGTASDEEYPGFAVPDDLIW